jgi:hypothetical protein
VHSWVKVVAEVEEVGDEVGKERDRYWMYPSTRTLGRGKEEKRG